mgnify:CR=1 FL=1
MNNRINYAPGYVDRNRLKSAATPRAMRSDLSALALCLALLPVFVQAASSSLIKFSTTGQSMWDSGAGVDFDLTQFYGVELDASAGLTRSVGIGGAGISGNVDGRVGIDVDFKFGTGTVDATMSFIGGLDPNYALFRTGQTVSIPTLGKLQAENALLQTIFPKFEFGADLVLDLVTSITARGFVDIPFVYSGDASTTLILPEIHQSMELVAINRNNDGQVRLVPALQQLAGVATDTYNAFSDLPDDLNEATNKKQKALAVIESLLPELGGVTQPPIAKVDVRLPEIETKGAKTTLDVAGQSVDVLQTDHVVDNDFLNLAIDVDGLMTAASGGAFPPLEVNVNLEAAGILAADVKLNILDITFNSSLILGQTFTLTPELVMDLSFDHAVMAAKSGGVLTSTTMLTGLRAGEEFFDLLWDSATPLQVTPTYRLTAMLNNRTDLGLDLSLTVDILSASASAAVAGFDVGSVSIGPLISKTFNVADLFGGLGSVDLFNSSFALQGFESSIAGGVITLDNSGAVFTGPATTLPGTALNWGDAANWVDGRIGEQGLAVLLDDSARPAGADPYAKVVIRSGEDFLVGNFVVGGAGPDGIAAGTVRGDIEIEVQAGGKLRQSAQGVTAFSNGGTLIVAGQLDVGAPISGQGDIFLNGGIVNGPLDLDGQTIQGKGTLNASGRFDIDARSVVGGYLFGDEITVNVSDVVQTRNEGALQAFGTLALHSSSAEALYTIDNRGGVIDAIGGTIEFSHQTTGSCAGSLCSAVRILGGFLSTGAGAEIVAGRLVLDGVTNDGNGMLTVQNQLTLENTLTNNGVISTGSVRLGRLGQSLAEVSILGTGELRLTGATPIGIEIPATAARLINGPGHTISGTGTIGQTAPLDFTNAGVISATIANGADVNAPNLDLVADNIVNTGVLESTQQTNLRLLSGHYEMADGVVHATGGLSRVVLFDGASTATTTDQSGNPTGGPGGTWIAEGGGRIELNDGANQWQSLTTGVLSGGEIQLIGNSVSFGRSQFVIDGVSLEDSLTTISETGILRLAAIDFDLSSTFDAAQAAIAGELQLANAVFKTRADLDVLGSSGEGQVFIGSGGLVHGRGTIDSDAVINLGTLRAAGGLLTVKGGIRGGGSFEAGNGATLRLDLGTCTILGVPCPFTRVVSASGEVSGQHFVVSAGDAAATLEFKGVDENPFIKKLTSADVTLSGDLADIRGVSTTLGTRTLEATLTELDGSRLALTEGKRYTTASSIFTLANAATLQLSDPGTAFAGNNLHLASGSNIDMRGGALQVVALTLNANTTLHGFGHVGLDPGQGSMLITNSGSLLADDGVLDLYGVSLNQSGTGRLEAVAVTQDGSPQAGSVLRLDSTQITGGALKVGTGAVVSLLDIANQNAVAVTNQGTLTVVSENTQTIQSFVDSTITSDASSLVLVSNAALVLRNSALVNTDRSAEILVYSAESDTADAFLALDSGATISGGTLKLVSEPTVVLETLSSGVLSRTETAPGKRAILSGGTLVDVNLSVDAFSIVDAAGGGTTIFIGSGSLYNAGTLQASSIIRSGRATQHGSLILQQGTITGAGEVWARDEAVVYLQNVVFDGASLHTEGTGIIRDVAHSTFANLTNAGTFEVAAGARATLQGIVNNEGGTLHILSGGVAALEAGDGPAGSGTIDPLLSSGSLVVDAGGLVSSTSLPFRLVNAAVSGGGIIQANVFLEGDSASGKSSSIDPGGAGSVGMLDVAGNLSADAASVLHFDLLGLGEGQFDQLIVGGALDLKGTVVVNLLGGVTRNEFLAAFTVFDFFLAGARGAPTPLSDSSVFDALSFTAMSSSGAFNLTLGIDGGFQAAPVPLPPALALMLAALITLFSMYRRHPISFRLKDVG